MSSQIERVCQAVTENFKNSEFTIDDVVSIIGDEISLPSLRQIIYQAKKTNGIIEVGKAPHDSIKKGPKKKIYKLKKLNPHKIARHNSIVRNKGKGLLFDDKSHPAKKFITEFFYTTFASYSNNVKNVLSLCGPNTKRFMSNVLKITNRNNSFITLIEHNSERATEIYNKLGNYRKYLPNHQIYNMPLEDFSNRLFYQFQELDCEGSWNLLYPLYEKRLLRQASNKRQIKGMIITTFARGKTIDDLNIPFSKLLSNLGAKFRKNEVLKKSTGKQIPGDWRYVHMYDDYPTCTNFGRIKKLVSFKYAQGSDMFTSLIIYK